MMNLSSFTSNLSQYHIMILQISRQQSLVNRNIGKEKIPKTSAFLYINYRTPIIFCTYNSSNKNNWNLSRLGNKQLFAVSLMN